MAEIDNLTFTVETEDESPAPSPRKRIEVTLPFGGHDRRFRLDYQRCRAVEQKRDSGLFALMHRIMSGGWSSDDLREVIYEGLIGGGMETREAAALLKTDFENLPLQQFAPLAQGILGAAIFGVEEA